MRSAAASVNAQSAVRVARRLQGSGDAPSNSEHSTACTPASTADQAECTFANSRGRSLCRVIFSSPARSSHEHGNKP
eukprot:6204025-Pleurochrysis_carterae.AAC.2